MKHIFTLSFFILFTSFYSFGRIVNVTNATALQNALNAAIPGDTISLKDGTYVKSGGFTVNAGINGTSSAPIVVTGSHAAIITSANVNTGYGLWLKGNSYWILKGFSVYNSKKGIVIDNSHHNVISDIRVIYIGDEGIHLRTYSSFNTVEQCYIDSMGIVSGPSGTAEGIYVGSANSNWGTYTGGNPDTCNYNIVKGNVFGDNIPSENIDIKEGTTGGIISNNTFNGKGLNGANSADSWVDVKGNNYMVTCNTGQYTMTDGVQTHIVYAGYGNYNTFKENNFIVGSTGYGIKVQTSGSSGTAPNNVVCNTNTVDAAALGVSNITLTSCTAFSATITPSGPTTFCSGGFVTLNANTGTGYIYKWKKNGVDISGATSSSYVANAAGSYTVVITNAYGCSATSSPATVTITSGGVTAIITPAGATTFCQGNSVLLNANTGAGYTYVWQKNNVTIGGATSSSYTATTSGSYTVIVSSGGCSATSSATTVTVNSTPTATATAGGPTTFCSGGSVILTASPSSGVTYQWSNSSGNIAGATNQTYTATSTGSYKVVVTNATTGCVSSASVPISVTVNSNPAATITSSGATTFCQGGSVKLNANTGAGFTYQWKYNTTDLAGATSSSYTATASGSYSVVVSSGSCSATSAASTITVNPNPIASITPSGPTTFCQGGSVQLNANTGTGLNYQWKNNTTDLPGATSSSYNATSSGSYSVVITNANGCLGMSGTENVTVQSSLTWYQDTDGDGLGDDNITQQSCAQPSGYVSSGGDNCPADPNKTIPGNCGCNKLENSCLDCAGVTNGGAFLDSCGVCAGGSTGITPITDKNACVTSVQLLIPDNHIARPNPFQNEIFVQVTGETSFKMLDVHGVVVKSGITTGKIEAGDILGGMYTLILINGEKTLYLKVMKE